VVELLLRQENLRVSANGSVSRCGVVTLEGKQVRFVSPWVMVGACCDRREVAVSGLSVAVSVMSQRKRMKRVSGFFCHVQTRRMRQMKSRGFVGVK
jgi:hypothetical protein